LAREVLYGRLKNGGHAQIDAGEEGFVFRFAALKSGSEGKATRNIEEESEKESEEALPQELREMLAKIRNEMGNGETLFATAEEAQEYARAHPGVWVRRQEGGEGYEVVER
jgi:hypothetical protein